MNDSLADDILYGTKAIAQYLGMNERMAYYHLEGGRLPAFKLGAKWCARKSALLNSIAAAEQSSTRGERTT